MPRLVRRNGQQWYGLRPSSFWIVGFLLPISTFVVTNDHFDRMSRARQLAQYGALPFRDFVDPGYFMTLFSSAALQRLFGDNLLGDILLDAFSIATGTLVVLLLARRLSGSFAAALVAAVWALLTLPRLYDFDKVLFYPLGILLCWRYVERGTPSSLVLLGAGLVAGATFRYDSGVYIGAAAVAALVVFHWRAWRTLAQRLALLAAAVTCAALPFLAFVQYTGGLLNAADQVVTYARREGARTRSWSLPGFSFGPLTGIEQPEPPSRVVAIRWAPAVGEAQRRDLAGQYALHDERRRGEPEDRTWAYRLDNMTTEHIGRLVADPNVEDTAGIDRRRFMLPPEPVWTRLQRSIPPLRLRILPGSWGLDNAAAFVFYLLLALPVLAIVLVHGVPGADVQQRARIVSLAVLCLMLHVFVLRDPIEARFGGIAGPALVLGLWVGGRAWRSRNPLGRAAVLLTAALAVWATATLANWPRHLEADLASPGRIRQNLRLMAASPPPMGDTLPSASLAGLVSYLRECTTPADRVYTSWFVPELYYYAQRGFAAGMAVTFGGHWSEPRYQQRMVEKAASEPVPIVILQMSAYNEFRNLYPAFDQVPAGSLSRRGRDRFRESGSGSDRLPGSGAQRPHAGRCASRVLNALLWTGRALTSTE